MHINQLLQIAVASGASDLHLKVGSYPMMRVNGTLVVDLVNPKTKEMVWRGTATDQVSGDGKDQGKVSEAVATIFKNFPPSPGTK